MTVAPDDPGKLLLCLESTVGAPQSDIEQLPWLVELREFRARIAWNSGRRPDFRQTDGTFADPDPHDLRAYHLMVRTDAGELIACCRYAPLEALPCSRIRELDPVGADRIAGELGCLDAEMLEGGRLLVAMQWRHYGLATELLLAGTALARLLDRRAIWGTAGVRDGQEHVFLRLGYHCAAADLIPAPHYDDELRIIVCDPARVPAAIEPRITALATELRGLLGRIEPHRTGA
ncbi:hypothetical protein [Nocardia sp. NPDC056100]|uniref:hypothetical protein n=1 Tax=Nocardia sp. NPDC056100 TaxID=3345712 RepID=UPI0035D8081C